LYDELKKHLEEEVIEVISSSLYPDLKGGILFSFLTLPMSIINRAVNWANRNSQKGFIAFRKKH